MTHDLAAHDLEPIGEAVRLLLASGRYSRVCFAGFRRAELSSGRLTSIERPASDEVSGGAVGEQGDHWHRQPGH